MNSGTKTALGLGALAGSFLAPQMSIVLLPAAIGLFMSGEKESRREIKYVRPLESARYQVWQKTLNHASQYLLGVNQAHAENQIDWHTTHRSQDLNLQGTVEDKYFTLFTAGRQPVQQPIDVPSQETQEPEFQPESQPEQPESESNMLALFTGAATMPEQPAQYIEEPGYSQQQGQPAMQSVQARSIDPTTSVPMLRLESFMRTAFLLIWGAQGGGKTTLAKRIARMREAQDNHKITVADPHGSKAEWGNWQVVGSARNYERLNEFLEEYDDAVTTDYEQYSIGKRNFAYQTLLADEFTQWADECDLAPKFVKSACSDIRKIHRCVIMVSHSDTMTGLGGASGMRAAIDRSAVKLELESEIDINTGEYRATGYGWLQYPGKDRIRVRIPHAQF